MMGSGKSSVGRALATRTGWPFHDNDALVERATGRTARQLMETDGELGLRRAEAAAMDAALATAPPVIAALAAGTILDAGDRRRLAGAGFVVWLRAPAEVLAARAAGGSHRPWLEDDPVGWFSATTSERDPLYASVASLTVDTSALDAEAAAERIVEALEGT
jgi:shikimate kinase